jgi:hypothetical protein
LNSSENQDILAASNINETKLGERVLAGVAALGAGTGLGLSTAADIAHLNENRGITNDIPAIHMEVPADVLRTPEEWVEQQGFRLVPQESSAQLMENLGDNLSTGAGQIAEDLGRKRDQEELMEHNEYNEIAVGSL